MMASFLVARSEVDDKKLLVMFKDPPEVLVISRDSFVDLMVSLAKQMGTFFPAYPDESLLASIAGVAVFSASKTDIARIRNAMKKLSS